MLHNLSTTTTVKALGPLPAESVQCTFESSCTDPGCAYIRVSKLQLRQKYMKKYSSLSINLIE